MKGVFITGTDTGVGKTVVSALTLMALRSKYSVRYWKPIQTGIEVDDDTATVKRLARCKDDEIFDSGYRLERPVSPHLAAKYVNIQIDIGQLLTMRRRCRGDHVWIIEGAGGVLVPINDLELMRDFIARLGLPVIVVARPSLGTINHTLLTIEALTARYAHVLGVVINGGENHDNLQAIEQYGRKKVLLQLPQLYDASQIKFWAAKFGKTLEKISGEFC